MAAVAHFPWTLDNDLLERARRPLATVIGLLLAIDLIGLGLRLADAGESPLADAPTRAKVRIGAPDAIVSGSSVFGIGTDRQSAGGAGQRTEPAGCLALASGCYPGAPSTPTGPADQPSTPTGPADQPPTGPAAPPPTPVVQADVAVPALGAQVSLGLGDGSCTSVVLTAIALGECPVESGHGPVVLNLGGALLGD